MTNRIIRVLIIIPAYNEQETIQNTIHTLEKYLHLSSEVKNYSADYIVINDGSTDHTEGILIDNQISHIRLVSNLGIGGAVQTGYKYARENHYDIAVQFDGDGQHDPEYLPSILEPVMNGADMCIGSRFIGDASDFKSTAARRAGIKMISWAIRLVTGTRIYDPTSGFRAVGRRIIVEFAKRYPQEYPEPESIVELLKQGYQVEEVPVRMIERKAGRSSIRAFKTVYYMITVCLSIVITGMKKRGK